MEKCKTKVIQADLVIFTHVPVHSRIFHIYSGIIKHIQELLKNVQAYLEPCVTLVYFEP